MNENAIHNGAADEYSPFRFGLSVRLSPLVSCSSPNKSTNDEDGNDHRPRHHHLEIRDDDLYVL